MPPKKAAVPLRVGEYDVELMTENELRMYIQALQEERTRMRKACNLYQTDKKELLNCLKNIQDKIVETGKASFQKNLEMQDHMMQIDQKLTFADVTNRITELENTNEVEKEKLESFTQLKTAETSNNKEEEALLKDITERDNEIEPLKYTFHCVLPESKEGYFTKFSESRKSLKDNYDDLVAEKKQAFHDMREEFSHNKIENLHAVWGDIPTSENNTFAHLIEKMSLYFEDISWKNVKTIDELQSRLQALKKEVKDTSLNLREVVAENNRLKSLIGEYDSSSDLHVSSPTFSPAKERALKELSYENYVLTEKLEMVNKEFQELKEKFVSAFRRIHQTADFKTLILENKLLAQQKTTAISP